MLFTMAISLYTSRLVLDALGVSDYGIYNVIAGIIVFISMINNSMAAATQRFITFELGKKDYKKVSDTFSMSMTAHIAISVVILLLGETIGLYYIKHYLNVPIERIDAAMWVYQIALISVVVTILRIPYSASVIAYEKMSFFAIISIIDSLMKLAVVLLLYVSSFDKLIFYSFLIFCITLFNNIVYHIYCNRKFKTCHYYWFIDKAYFKKMSGFFGWNFVGVIATLGTRQAGNLIINFFCGPIANAAYGVAAQVNGAVGGLANNFQMAYTPQIVKLYSQEKRSELFVLMNRSALLSFYLLFIVSMPIILHIDLVLGIWLKEVPPYAGIFCIWFIIYALIDSVQAPLWKVIGATGNIRNYEIWLNIVLILNIPLSYYCLKSGMPPYTVVMISSILNFLTAVLRTIHVKIQVNFPVIQYLQQVIFHVILVILLYMIFHFVTNHIIAIDNLYKFILFFIISAFYTIFIIYMFGINRTDKQIIINLLKSKICHYK